MNQNANEIANIFGQKARQAQAQRQRIMERDLDDDRDVTQLELILGKAQREVDLFYRARNLITYPDGRTYCYSSNRVARRNFFKRHVTIRFLKTMFTAEMHIALLMLCWYLPFEVAKRHALFQSRRNPERVKQLNRVQPFNG